MNIDSSVRDDMYDRARRATDNAYCPYSGFPVGAAVYTLKGNAYSGCNVENASYGLTLCAERNAIFQAVAAGERDFVLLVIYTPTDSPTSPCGACRQVICEFAPDCDIIAICDTPAIARFTGEELLPVAFGPKNL